MHNWLRLIFPADCPSQRETRGMGGISSRVGGEFNNKRESTLLIR